MKRRKGLDRRTPLRSHARLERRAPIRTRNPKRKRAEFARSYGSVDRVLRIRAMPCLACGAVPSENAHVPSQSGAGRKGDARHVIPLCRTHHRELDSELGPAHFSRRYGLDLAREAERVNATLED